MEINHMKKLGVVLALAVAFGAGAVVSAQVHDWHDLDAVHQHVLEAMREMDRARAANHYDMHGHGAKAEAALHEAEHQLDLAVRDMRGM
jgi:valyl-tRNA synthetase